MDIETVKLKLMDLISNADSRLSPRQTHVLGNWHLQAWQLPLSSFPIVTVRLSIRQQPVYGFHTPTISHGEYYLYDATIFVWGPDTGTDTGSIQKSREVADLIIDYLYQHNKAPISSTVNIIDITNIRDKEGIQKKGPKRFWRIIVECRLICEESLG